MEGQNNENKIKSKNNNNNNKPELSFVNCFFRQQTGE